MWKLFEGDGNYIYGPTVPDFSIITSVVVELGGRGSARPGEGKGAVDIGEITVTDDKQR